MSFKIEPEDPIYNLLKEVNSKDEEMQDGIRELFSSNPPPEPKKLEKAIDKAFNDLKRIIGNLKHALHELIKKHSPYISQREIDMKAEILIRNISYGLDADGPSLKDQIKEIEKVINRLRNTNVQARRVSRDATASTANGTKSSTARIEPKRG